MLSNWKHNALYVAFKERKKALARRLRLARYRGTDYRCPVCGTGLRAFKPVWKSYVRKLTEHGYVYPLDSLETFNISAYSCPACDASDRERLYALFLDDLFASLDNAQARKRFVEFAPSLALQQKIRRYPGIEYRSADLFRRTVDDQIDITDMRGYSDSSVDLFLCSHILEHVPDDLKAMRELHRILKPGGSGIVMVPLIEGVDETHEDPNLVSPAQRWKYYGQDDHIRQYGKRDFLRRLEGVGFAVETLGVDHFGEERFRLAGIARGSVLYVTHKRPEHSNPG
jgi:SAM-dependent methyltransferase